MHHHRSALTAALAAPLAALVATPALAQTEAPTIDAAIVNRVQQNGTANERNLLPVLETVITQNNPALNQFVGEINTSTGTGTKSLFNSATGESYGSTANAQMQAASASSRVSLERLEDLRSPTPRRMILAPALAAAPVVQPAAETRDFSILLAADSFASPYAQTPASPDTSSSAAGTVLDPGDPPRGGVWGRLHGVTGDIEATRNASGVDYGGGGVVLGADYRVTDQLIAGVSFGYTRLESDFSRVADGDDADAYSLTLYGTYLLSEDAWLDGSLGYTYSQHHLTRSGPLGTRPTSEFDTHAFYATLGGGYNFDLNEEGTWRLQPLASIAFTSLQQDDVNESGGGPFGLSIDEVELSSLRGGVGLKLLYEARVSPSLLLIPEARIGYQHEFLDDNATVASTFAGGAPGSSFTVESSDVDRDYYTLGAGLTAHTDRNVSAFLGYDVALNDDFIEHNLTGGLRYSW